MKLTKGLLSIGHGNAYSLDIDSYWASMSAVEGDGVQLSNFTIKNWKGTEAYGLNRGPIKMICADGAPCYDITIEDFAMWTEKGDRQWYSCESAYGTGFCLQDSSDHVSYAVTTTTVYTAPSGYSAATMAADLTTAFGSTVSIPIPTIPTSFYPGATPYSALMADSSSSTAKARALSASGSAATHASISSSSISSAAVAQTESIPVATSTIVAISSAAEEAFTTAAPSAAAPTGAGNGPQPPSASGQAGHGEQGQQGEQEVCYVQ